mgnify:CR=1 FL=1
MSKPTGKPRGRPNGAKNKHTKAREDQMAASAKVIEKILPNVFTGDAHALLMLTYKNELLDIDLRLDAAKAAVRYEKPALSTASVDVNGGGPMVIEIVRFGRPKNPK